MYKKAYKKIRKIFITAGIYCAHLAQSASWNNIVFETMRVFKMPDKLYWFHIKHLTLWFCGVEQLSRSIIFICAAPDVTCQKYAPWYPYQDSCN